MLTFDKKPPHLRNGYKDKKRLEQVRELSCIACEIRGEPQQSRTEVHHFIGLGLGKKASDLLTIPLCNKCHTGSYTSPKKGLTIHWGLKAFEERHGTQEELLKITNERLSYE